MSSSTASIGGLVSGLDTATIISQLMAIEATPQTQLKSQLGTKQSTVSSLQTLNAKVAALATRSTDLAKATAWNPVSAGSSQGTVAVSAGSLAVPGNITFTIDRVAAAHAVRFNTSAALDDVVTTGPVKLTMDGVETEIDTGDGSLSGLVSALNASGAGVRATTIALDDGSYRLRVESTATGVASAFTLSNLDGSDVLGGSSVLTTGQDAAINVDGDLLHSASNTFTGLMAGVSVTLSAQAAVGSTATVSVVRDTAALTGSVSALVDALNFALDDIDSLTRYDPVTKAAGKLSGESAVRQLREELLATLYPSDGSSLASVGIQVDRSGKFVFDSSAFAQAYAADPGKTMDMFTAGATDGFAARVASVAKLASESSTGTLSISIAGHAAGAKRLETSIADWDRRLEMRQETLTRRFTALETAMSAMRSQSNWLASQIDSLSSLSQSSKE